MNAAGATIGALVEQVVGETAVTDVHTHLYPTGFGGLLLRGPDELLTYHYLIAEALRASELPYDRFWAMSKKEQAEFIWQELFIRRSPLSEACRGVLTAWQRLGLDVDLRQSGLEEVRRWAASISEEEYVDRVFRAAHVRQVVMTNDVFDPQERSAWQRATGRDPRFLAALRIDPLLVQWELVATRLAEWGYSVESQLPLREKTVFQLRRFLDTWIERLNPVYLAASLPPGFAYDSHPRQAGTVTVQMFRRVLIPTAQAHGLPIALMIGVRRQVNPQLRLAGDSVGRADVTAVENLCLAHPEIRFLVTLLSRENQHELAVAARKFHNLMPFGCWWFLNNPSLIREITRMRLELLGTTFIPQHSDARVLDQLVYKWAHTRTVLTEVLSEQYGQLAQSGWVATPAEVRRDVAALLGGNFWRFVGRQPSESGELN